MKCLFCDSESIHSFGDVRWVMVAEVAATPLCCLHIEHVERLYGTVRIMHPQEVVDLRKRS